VKLKQAKDIHQHRSALVCPA